MFLLPARGMGSGMVGNGVDALMANPALLLILRAQMAGGAMGRPPAGGMGIGMLGQGVDSLVTDTALIRLWRSLVTGSAMFLLPTRGVGTGMLGHRVDPFMTDTALVRLRRSLVAGGAVGRAPAGGMGIGMRLHSRLMTHPATRSLRFGCVTGIAMRLFPARLMRLGPNGFMARRAGVFLMADQATLATPGRLDAVGFQTPLVIMGGGHGRLMALPA